MKATENVYNRYNGSPMTLELVVVVDVSKQISTTPHVQPTASSLGKPMVR
jgi:hypothetical protein